MPRTILANISVSISFFLVSMGPRYLKLFTDSTWRPPRTPYICSSRKLCPGSIFFNFVLFSLILRLTVHDAALNACVFASTSPKDSVVRISNAPVSPRRAKPQPTVPLHQPHYPLQGHVEETGCQRATLLKAQRVASTNLHVIPYFVQDHRLPGLVS